ncbi:MAG: hypothetical protein CBB97_21765 [Candidatus Endolissoclinum sp. TMED37]|nr:MAG: hypothetical protein CBB97_21765 [Candidatus Endolissoclinum sp. TMED37]
MKAIKKLKDNKIFGADTIVESVVKKSLWGSPVFKKAFLKVKKAEDEFCICEEVGEADGKAHKINYINVLTVDGQEPNELAAVYGLGPKTARFKRRKAE